MWFTVIESAITVLAVACAIWFYAELRRWAKFVKYGRIAVAYKRKVVIDAPMQEWVLWMKMLHGDGASNGRVVYQMGNTRIAIVKGVRPTKAKPIVGPNQPQVKEGRWEKTS